MMRPLSWILVTITGLLLFLITTTAGLRIGLYALSYSTPIKITVERLQGNAITGIRAKEIRINTPGFHGSVGLLHFRWNPLELLQRTLSISTVTIKNIHFGKTQIPLFTLQKIEIISPQNSTTLNITATLIKPTSNTITAQFVFSPRWRLPMRYRVNLPKIKAQGSFSKNTITSRLVYGKNTAQLQLKKINQTWHVNLPALCTVLEKQPICIKAQGTMNNLLITSSYAWRIPFLHIIINKPHLRITRKNNQPWLQGTIQSQGKPIAIEGFLNNLSFHITANNALLMQTAPITAHGSADITMAYKDGTLSFKGKGTVTKGEIRPSAFGSGATELPGDVVIISNQKTVKHHLNITANIALHINDKAVQLNYHGISGQLDGNLAILYSPQHLATAMGMLTLHNGKFQAYGQKIPIDKGILTFNGGTITNPSLEATASKKVQVSQTQSSGALFSATTTTTTDIVQLKPFTVGIKVTGNIQQYKITPFSIPSTLTPAQILSYFILGAGTGIPSEGAAALSVGALPLGGITKKLQKRLGLSQLGIQSAPVVDSKNNQLINNTSVVVGKQLTKRISLSYSVGLIKPINTFNVHYKISPKWSLRGSTNSISSGVDLFYTVNK